MKQIDASKELWCLFTLLHLLQESGIVSSYQQGIGVLWPQLLLTDGQSTLVQQFSLGIFSLVPVEAIEIN